MADKYIYLVPAFGYRFQKSSGGFFFKALASPTVILDPPSGNFWHMDPQLSFTLSLCLGLSF